MEGTHRQFPGKGSILRLYKWPNCHLTCLWVGGWLTGGVTATGQRHHAALCWSLFLPSGCQGRFNTAHSSWPTGLCKAYLVSFRPQVIPFASLETFCSRRYPLMYFMCTPCFIGVLVKGGSWFSECGCFTFLLFTESSPSANKYAGISAILEKCLLLTQLPLTAISRFFFFSSFCIQTPPKGCPYLLMPVSSLSPHIHLHETSAFTTPSKWLIKGTAGLVPPNLRVAFGSSPAWALPGAQARPALLSEVLSLLGFRAALFRLSSHPASGSFCLLFCFLLFLSTPG